MNKDCMDRIEQSIKYLSRHIEGSLISDDEYIRLTKMIDKFKDAAYVRREVNRLMEMDIK